MEHMYGHVVNQDLTLLSVSKSARDHSLCTYRNECYTYKIQLKLEIYCPDSQLDHMQW